MKAVPQIHLTKKLLQNEPRRSYNLVDADTRHLRDAVLTAHKLSQFYHGYQATVEGKGEKSNVMPRDAIQLLSQMQSQTLFVCERTDEGPDCPIVAGSVLWKHELPIPSNAANNIEGYEVETFWEFGTQVSAMSGFSLQWVLTAITILERLAFDPAGLLVAATYGDNLRAASNFLNGMHFVEWKDVPATLSSLRIHHLREADEEARGVRWFRPTASTVIGAAELLLDLRRHPRRQVSGRAANPDYPEIELTIDASSFRIALERIEEMAERIISERPSTRERLMELLDNETVSENLIHW